MSPLWQGRGRELRPAEKAGSFPLLSSPGEKQPTRARDPRSGSLRGALGDRRMEERGGPSLPYSSLPLPRLAQIRFLLPAFLNLGSTSPGLGNPGGSARPAPLPAVATAGNIFGVPMSGVFQGKRTKAVI